MSRKRNVYGPTGWSATSYCILMTGARTENAGIWGLRQCQPCCRNVVFPKQSQQVHSTEDLESCPRSPTGDFACENALQLSIEDIPRGSVRLHVSILKYDGDVESWASEGSHVQAPSRWKAFTCNNAFGRGLSAFYSAVQIASLVLRPE